MSKSSTPLIFVHGAWHGAWCWQKIVTPLKQLGFNVLAPDLPGHGQHICTPSLITMQDYISSLITLIQAQNEPVTLIGHSMGGIIISSVAESIPNHIHTLIYLTAFIPEHGESLLSMASQFSSHALLPFLTIDQEKSEIRIDSSERLFPIFFNCCEEQDARWAKSQLHSQPLKPLRKKIHLKNHFNRIPKKAILCREDHIIPLHDQRKMAKRITDDIIEINSDHAAYCSAREELVHYFFHTKE